MIPALPVAGGLGLFFHDHEAGLHLDRVFVQHAAMGAAGVAAGAALLLANRVERWSVPLRWTWPALLAVTAAVLLGYAE